MNITDVKEETTVDGDRLELIFEKQESLKEKYHHIEEAQGVGYGLIKGRKFNINEIKSQCLLKDMAWRVVEEITEATVCHPERERQHFLEELADALHFLTELCIVAGIGPYDIAIDIYEEMVKGDDDDLDMWSALFYTPNNIASSNPYNTVQHLGLAMNCLKQKPWKQTHILTDEKRFRQHIIDAFRAFCKYLTVYSGAKEMYDFYFKKNKVNQFRQESNY